MRIIKKHQFQFSLFAGLHLILIGLLLVVVDSFILTSPATSVLTDWFGAPERTVEGTFQRLVVDAGMSHYTLDPPSWVGWATTSTGIVLSAYGVFGKKWKK